MSANSSCGALCDMSPPAFDTFSDAYKNILSALLRKGMSTPGTTDPTSVGSHFGRRPRPTRELLGVGFTINDPLSILFYSTARPLNLPYVIGQFLWVMSGSNELDYIAHYNPRGHAFSDDSSTLRAAAGTRLIKPSGRGSGQLDAVIERLRSDTASRRTTCLILFPEDNHVMTRDYPCCIGVNFFIRDNSLCSVVFMRSQSGFGVLPYDVSLFGLLQTWVAAQLELAVGTYTHICASLHVYDDEIDRVQRVLSAPITPVRFEAMTSAGDGMRELLEAECTLRRAVESGDVNAISAIARVEEGGFWAQARLILLAHASRCLECDGVFARAVTELDDGLKSLLVADARHWHLRGQDQIMHRLSRCGTVGVGA